MQMTVIYKIPARALGAALVSATLCAGAASAQQAGVLDLNVTKIVTKSVAGKGAVKHDWLAKRDANDKARMTVSSASPGTGSWVCSPAGFGKKSKCYAR
jgi:hypothetical protein